MKRRFEITKQHLALMKSMWITWWDCEFGAPAVDPKRPYGDSDVFGNIAEIIGVSVPNRDDYEEFPPEVEEKLARLHAEMQTAIAIMLQCGKLKLGEYTADEYDDTTWKKI